MQTVTRPTPYQLADAITNMAIRCFQAERTRGVETERWIRGRTDDRGAMDRADRTCDRRFKALLRLTEALRKQADR